jgi:hypothetical protein
LILPARTFPANGREGAEAADRNRRAAYRHECGADSVKTGDTGGAPERIPIEATRLKEQSMVGVVALVTGAGSGIGACVARRFAEEGVYGTGGLIVRGENPRQKECDHAVAPGGPDAYGDQGEHVPVTRTQGPRAADEKRPAGPRDDGREEQKLKSAAPGRVADVRERWREMQHSGLEHGQRQCASDPQERLSGTCA